jgi:hypothetical protein
MNTFATLCSAFVIGLMLVGGAAAAPVPDDQPKPPHDGLLTPGDRHSTDVDAENPRVLTGRVVRVNAQEGTIVIQTPMGLIALRGPQEELRGVNVGDLVQVEMVEGDYPSASPPLEPSDEQK